MALKYENLSREDFLNFLNVFNNVLNARKDLVDYPEGEKLDMAIKRLNSAINSLYALEPVKKE